MSQTKIDKKMKESEQVDVFWRAAFTWLIQMMFCTVLALYSNIKTVIARPTEVHVVLFFTILLLHLTCLPQARDGLAMMKYSILHPEEFVNPVSAWLCGLFCLSSMIFAETVNVLNSQSKTKVGDAIAAFIGFKCMVDLPTIFMNSHEEFPLKSAIGTLTFKRGRKEERPTYIENN